jgi:hypothetical protein
MSLQRSHGCCNDKKKHQKAESREQHPASAQRVQR